MEVQDMKRQRGQGIIAGINAVLKIRGEEPFNIKTFRCIYRSFNR